MTPKSCPHERSAARAGRGGRWNDELAAHLAECVSCRESSRVARWMMALAEGSDSRLPPLPDARLVWLQARLLVRSRRSERALLPIRIAGALTAVGSGRGSCEPPRRGLEPELGVADERDDSVVRTTGPPAAHSAHGPVDSGGNRSGFPAAVHMERGLARQGSGWCSGLCRTHCRSLTERRSATSARPRSAHPVRRARGPQLRGSVALRPLRHRINASSSSGDRGSVAVSTSAPSSVTRITSSTKTAMPMSWL